MTGPWAGRRVHLIGIGGAGMSAYARAAVALGAQVSGSDGADGPALGELRDLGVEVHVGHHAAQVPDGAEIFASTAVGADNPERLPGTRPRAELLRELSGLKRTIAVAGAHGKTTTSSMVAHVLLAEGLDPSYLIGGRLAASGTNAAWGDGEWLVVEADESDRSMLALEVEVAVVTNVELDHHATFGSLEEVREVFRAFLARPARAVLWDRPDVLALRPPGAQAVAFDAPQAPLALQVPGIHNQRNAAAAVEACVLAGIERSRAVAALESFAGSGRRFEELGRTPAGARVVDDYAHHPTEVAATLQAARSIAPGRVVAVLQPHLFSRTAALAAEFGTALAAADVPVVVGIYPAREHAADWPGVTGELVARATARASGGREVLYLPSLEDAERVLRERLRPDDLLLVLGAGDVRSLGERLVG